MTERSFAGFSDRSSYVPVPTPFFGALLRDMDDLAELKLSLWIWRLLHEQRRHPQLVRRSALFGDRGLLLTLSERGPREPEEIAEQALRATIGRGVFLEVAVRSEGGPDSCILLNTPKNRDLVAQVERGERGLGDFAAAAMPADVADANRNQRTIFELYEQNIGLLTPLVADELREAELTYPPAWIDDAFREAVGQNKRSWRYIRRILETWTTRGRGSSGEAGRRPAPIEDPRRYLEGKFRRVTGR